MRSRNKKERKWDLW